MKYRAVLIVVADIERSKAFYQKMFDLEIESDFGENVTFSGGISLQTAQSWQALTGISARDLSFGGNTAELYFEEDDFDGFCEKLLKIPDVEYVHATTEHSWGQRVVRIYDPDRHIIEIGENMVMVVCRFIKCGLSPEETALRMDVPLGYVMSCIGKKAGE